MSRRLLLILVVTMLAAAGCGGAASLASWKNSVERYVQDTGGGDPGALRDVKLADGRRGFSVLGAAIPRESTDANAVLLGHAPVNGQPRFIYLVGIVEREDVKDIRLATLLIVNGKYDWSTGKKNSDALRAYRQSRDRTSFPNPADRFNFNVTDQAIVATHQQSGARWELATK